MPKRSDKCMVWMDCEMTGLDPQKDVLIEIATIITDYDLSVIARGPDLAIRTSESRLAKMDAWNRRTHKKSGLIERIRTAGVSTSEAERQTLAFVKKYCTKRTAPLCGNSIHQDRRFLARYMPELNEYLHYRMVDVSTIKVLVREWYGSRVEPPQKEERHRALADIEDSIAELQFYREAVFVKP